MENNIGISGMNRCSVRKLITFRQASGTLGDLPIHLPDRVVVFFHRNPVCPLKQQRLTGIRNIGNIDLRHRISLHPELRHIHPANILHLQGYIIKSGLRNFQLRAFRSSVPLNILPAPA